MVGNEKPMAGGRDSIGAAFAGRRGKSPPRTAGPGKETPVSPRKVQEGGSAGEAAGTKGSLLSVARAELEKQHASGVKHSPAVSPNGGHHYGKSR